MLVTKQLMVAIYFHNMKVNGYQQQYQHIFFWVQRKKETTSLNDLRVSNFSWTIHFKSVVK